MKNNHEKTDIMLNICRALGGQLAPDYPLPQYQISTLPSSIVKSA